MTKKISEFQLRDQLAANIEIIEPGLIILDKEKYIPNQIGTRSFIDLYARDAAGRHVLIELKRTSAASRDAIHEILKYVEAVKRNFGARDDEIRVIIASVEWDELLVPFSRFSADTTIEITGLLLLIDDTGLIINAEAVEPTSVTVGRVLAPWHELNFYTDEVSLQRGLKDYEAACKRRGVSDYVLVVLSAPPGYHEREKRKLQASIERMRGDGPQIPSLEMPSAEEIASRLPDYRFILYFAMQRLTRDQCLAIVARDDSQWREVQECLPSIEEDGEEAALCYLHEAIGCMEPRPHYDGFEIGYPAKFQSRLLDREGWTIEQIRRYGAFERNVLLTDEALLAELSGSHGHTGQRFKRTISVSNRAEMSAARTELQECLYANPVWQAHISRHLLEIERDFPESQVEISVFNPCTGILTILFATSREDGILYIPTYSIRVQKSGSERMYYGCLCADGVPTSYRAILDKYYASDVGVLLHSVTWGGYESRDTEILEDLGLIYSSFRCDVEAEERSYFQLRNERWRSCELTMPFDPFFNWCKANEPMVRHIIAKLAPRFNGGLINGSSTERPLEKLVDIEKGLRRRVYFSPPPETCDLCDCLFSEEKFMIDGGIKGHGAWACMCSDCFETYGKKIGWGSGQLYLKQPDGWLLVAGFSPNDMESEE